MADLGSARDVSPSQSNFFHFHEVFGKNYAKNRLEPPFGLAPPSSGNPGCQVYLFSIKTMHVNGDGSKGTYPLSVQFLSFSCSLHQFFSNDRLAPPLGLASFPGKFWISHCMWNRRWFTAMNLPTGAVGEGAAFTCMTVNSIMLCIFSVQNGLCTRGSGR